MNQQGSNALARIIQQRVGENFEKLRDGVHYGEIQADYSLLLNHFPCPIPQGDYMVCCCFGKGEIFSGMRVLVAEVGDDFCVVDGICSSAGLVFRDEVL